MRIVLDSSFYQVGELKGLIEKAQHFAAASQKLIFAGKILKDDVTLESGT
jgi:hypothetical protein